MSESFSAAIQDSPERGSSKIPNRFSIFGDLAGSGVAERKSLFRHVGPLYMLVFNVKIKFACSTLCSKMCSTFFYVEA